jgi:hypothetical protein
MDISRFNYSVEALMAAETWVRPADGQAAFEQFFGVGTPMAPAP